MKALIYELEMKIPELKDKIYPTNAPESAEKPYLVYYLMNDQQGKTLNGFTSNQTLRYMFSCMAVRYRDMKSLTDKVKAFLMTLPRTSIGENKDTYVQDLDINNVSEVWESQLKVNRGIIDFTIYI